jgi:hypothetical protein
MLRARIAAPVAGIGGVLLLLGQGGCASEGSYEVRWSFGDPALAAFQAGDCGAHGVSAIAIAGRRDDGTVDNPVASCGPGSFTRKLATGTWTLALTAVDAAGQAKTPDQNYLRGGITIVVPEDQVGGTDQGPVVLLPLPACQDGVDNDCDGRVDLDDLGCSDAAGLTEQGTDLMLDPQPDRRPGAPSACTP